MRRGGPPSRATSYVALLVPALLIAWQLPGTSGWRLAVSLALIAGDLATIVLLETRFRRREAAAGETAQNWRRQR